MRRATPRPCPGWGAANRLKAGRTKKPAWLPRRVARSDGGKGGLLLCFFRRLRLNVFTDLLKGLGDGLLLCHGVFLLLVAPLAGWQWLTAAQPEHVERYRDRGEHMPHIEPCTALDMKLHNLR